MNIQETPQPSSASAIMPYYVSVLKAPFPWFGGKSRVADQVWRNFGDVGNYVEPFAGSLAVLLGRPSTPRTETVNDADCYLANFWRALANDPEGVAAAATKVELGGQLRLF
jgi:site-specific DNA-adenine methylase